jgi:hypothetical protein
MAQRWHKTYASHCFSGEKSTMHDRMERLDIQ